MQRIRAYEDTNLTRHALKRLATGKSMSQSAPIDVFQLATQGHTMGDARYVNAQFAGTLAYVIRRGCTCHGRVGSQNQFFHRLLLQQAGQRADTNFLWADTVDG